ncbi:hypothetical protein [Actinoplanes sp. NPDC049265]|uniref:hypothetical protein n=1 Tax=Actinoplanes sp. NPDC049265 TaxID=3363902 RepID=UPI0037211280
MSRLMNPGPPPPRALEQGRSGDRPFPAAPGPLPRQRTPDRPEPTVVVGVDLSRPLPDIAGGSVTLAWLLLRIGEVPIGELLLRVPPEGLSAAQAGAAIAARIGARRRSARRASDGQPRSRRRGSTSSL